MSARLTERPETIPGKTRPRVVYVEDFGGWFKMSPLAWSRLVEYAISHSGEWDVRIVGGSELRGRPRCVHSVQRRTVGGNWWQWSAPDDVLIVHPRYAEASIWYWQSKAEDLAAWGIGRTKRCGFCDECLEEPDKPCEAPNYIAPLNDGEMPTLTRSEG